MFSPNPRSDKFTTQLPTDFFLDDICQKYNRYIQLQNSYFTSINQLVNESIQSLEIPGLSQELASQTTTAGDSGSASGVTTDVTLYPDTRPLEEIIESNTITVQFRHLDSYINYFFLMETFYKMYNLKTSNDARRFILPVTCLSVDNHPVFNVIFSKCLFKSINGLTLGYNQQARDFRTFSCEFAYSDFSVEFDLPQGTAAHYK